MKTQELQLLYIFDAIMTERSVTRAADRLAMTQPAVSNAISRMRQIWNDPLFVRKGRNIEPTSYALSLWDQVGDPMFALTNAVSATQFDPASARRTFRIAVTDVIVEMIWRQLIDLLEREAPGVDVHAVPYTPEGSYDDRICSRNAGRPPAGRPANHHGRVSGSPASVGYHVGRRTRFC